MKRFLAAVTATFLLSSTALAQTVQETKDSVTFTLGNDRYMAGNFLTVTTEVAGDIFAAGNQVSIQAPVSADVHAAGNSVTINAAVADDIRAAGANMLIGADIGGDAMLFGANINVNNAATIGGSAVFAGANIIIDGDINGNVKIDGDTVTINGSVAGTADIRAQNLTVNGSISGNTILAARNLTLGESARFGSNVRYWTEEGERAIPAEGTATFDDELAGSFVKDENAAAAFAGILTAITIYSILSAAVVILVLQLLTKTLFVDSAKHLKAQPWVSLLWGLLYFVVTPVVAILFCITLIGIPVGIIILLLYVISIILAKSMTAIILARFLELRGKKKWHPAGIFFASLGIFILLKLISLVPIIGWIVCFLAVLSAIGALMQAKATRYRKVA